jgi:hypothetical protein
MNASELIETFGPDLALELARAGEASQVPAVREVERVLRTSLAYAAFSQGRTTDDVSALTGCSRRHARRMYDLWKRLKKEKAPV